MKRILLLAHILLMGTLYAQINSVPPGNETAE